VGEGKKGIEPTLFDRLAEKGYREGEGSLSMYLARRMGMWASSIRYYGWSLEIGWTGSSRLATYCYSEYVQKCIYSHSNSMIDCVERLYENTVTRGRGHVGGVEGSEMLGIMLPGVERLWRVG
jgi:hypothetical protein